MLQRPCAHLYETGGLRRAHVRGHENVLKRLLVHASAFNLVLWMRTLFGIGTPRALQGRVAAFVTVLAALWSFTRDAIARDWHDRVRLIASGHRRTNFSVVRESAPCTTAC